MKKYQLATVSSPSIEFEVGGHIIESTVISNTAKNPNFDDPLFFFDIVSCYKRNRIPSNQIPQSQFQCLCIGTVNPSNLPRYLSNSQYLFQ